MKQNAPPYLIMVDPATKNPPCYFCIGFMVTVGVVAALGTIIFIAGIWVNVLTKVFGL